MFLLRSNRLIYCFNLSSCRFSRVFFNIFCMFFIPSENLMSCFGSKSNFSISKSIFCFSFFDALVISRHSGWVTYVMLIPNGLPFCLNSRRILVIQVRKSLKLYIVSVWMVICRFTYICFPASARRFFSIFLKLLGNLM